MSLPSINVKNNHGDRGGGGGVMGWLWYAMRENSDDLNSYYFPNQIFDNEVGEKMT